MVKCRYCNTENDENSVICQNCGEKIPSKKTSKGRNKLILILIGILGFIVLLGAIFIVTSGPQVSKFDQSLINSVKNGESPDNIISKVKDHSQINRHGSKAGYDAITSGGQSDNNSKFLEEAKENYDNELEYIQKIENLQISFAKREINEETFIKELIQLYDEQPELDY